MYIYIYICKYTKVKLMLIPVEGINGDLPLLGNLNPNA